MSDDNEGTSIELDLKNKTGKITGKKTAEIISVLCALALVAVGGGLWVHARDSRDADASTLDTLKAMVQGQREQTCLIGFPEHQREQKADFCRRVAR